MPPERDQPEVHVVGAGPAGLSSAIVLARGGRAVIVHEASGTVGSRFHDDFQGLENWSSRADVLEELDGEGIRATFDHVPIREQTVFGPDGRESRLRATDRPFYYLVRRGPGSGTVDRALLDQAVRAGVDVRFHDRVQHLPRGGVVAHGPRASDVIAVGYVFGTKREDGMFAALDDALAPGGYAYLLIHGGRATLATCMYRDFHAEKAYLDRTLAFFRARVGFDMADPRRFGGRGTFGIPRSAEHDGMLYVGESAGFQDPLWGFGMRYAMQSGSLAARCLLDPASPAFDARWRTQFRGRLRIGIVNRYLYGRAGNRAYRLMLAQLARTRSPRDWLRRQYAPVAWKEWLYPLAKRSVLPMRPPHPCARGGCDCTWCRCHRDERHETQGAEMP